MKLLQKLIFLGTSKFTSTNKASSLGIDNLFRYATKWEAFLMVIGGLCSIGTGLAVPWNVDMFGKLVGGMVDAQIVSAFKALGIDVSKYIITDVMESVTNFAIGTLIISGIMLGLTYVSISLFNYTSQNQSLRIRTIYLKSILHQDISWYDVMSCSDVASRLTEDVIKLEDGIGEKFVIFLHNFVAVIGCIVLAFHNGWKLASICLVPLIVIIVILYAVAKATASLTRKEVDVYATAGAIAEEAFSAIRTVAAFGGEKSEFLRYKSNLLSTYKNNINSVLISALEFGLIWLSTYITYSFAYWYGVDLILRERLLPIGTQSFTPSSMATIFFSVMMGTANLCSGAMFIETFKISKASAVKVFSVIERNSNIDSLSLKGLKPPDIGSSIEFKNVSFEYPSRPEIKVLKNLSFSVKEGETVALVGSSGCGKSTCIQLVQRFYDVSGGQILIDGYDLRDLNIKWFRNKLGTVGQEPILFDTKVAENIRYGNVNASMEKIILAAKEANAHNFIMKLPYQYDTLVGEGGTKISGGQKQRITIARALVRDPNILLLDEATSALDTKMEAKVQAALDKVYKGRTTIIVAHRLTTIREADKIIVLKNGEVIEEGNHDYLMRLKGHYHSLVTAQATDISEIHTGEIKKPTEKKKTLEIPDDESSTMSEISREAENIESIDAVSTMKILELSKPEWFYILPACFASIIVGCSPPLFSTFFGDVIDELSGPDSDLIRSRTSMYCTYFVTAGVLIGASNFAQCLLFGIASECLTLRLRGLIFQTMLRQEIGWFDDPSNGTGALCSKLSTEAAAVRGATGQRIGIIVQSYSTIILSVSMAIYYEWRLGLVGTAFIPLILVTGYLQNLMYRRETLSYHKDLATSTKIAVEAVSNIRTVMALGIEETCHNSYVAAMQPSYLLAKKNTHIRGLIFALARSVSYIALAACMYYGGYLMKREVLHYSTVFKVSQTLIMGTIMVADASAHAPNVQKGLQAAASIISILKRKPKIQDLLCISENEEKCNGEVKYKDVVFQYPTRCGTRVLDDFNLEVPPGKTIALIGPSGCGKSTIIQVLERFYDPVFGTVKLDSKDIETMSLASLRKHLGLVSQEPTLFARTIAENIAYGDNTRQVPMWEIIEAAKQANIHHFISALPRGYETKLGDRGTQISGGQKQRIAIARVLIRDPKILLLDEATSALDSESEKVVQAALDKTREGRTCILIAHRLSTVENADKICVMSDGQVAESGTHKELFEKKGLYYELLCLQNAFSSF
ncbi:ATP-dependent translocase ABCB1-like isoform X2 [Belonocnema kinseyi]|uniref:ATP-dependent translocase ABCB1-like isoform X2 n=1 Tax=Belonocnema kinseyi TaxID=2817044 RepID=UPI00143D678C|nr:ATP-dependent translocase ABCB1-like isoform X2 [Belonocnema kinseyi]